MEPLSSLGGLYAWLPSASGMPPCPLAFTVRWADFPGYASAVWFWAKLVKVQSDVTVGGRVLPQDSSHFRLWYSFWGSKSSVLWQTSYKFEGSLYLFTFPTSLDWLIEFQGVLYLGLQCWYEGHIRTNEETSRLLSESFLGWVYHVSCISSLPSALWFFTNLEADLSFRYPEVLLGFHPMDLTDGISATWLK